jgi:membrane associated rhomboid family serine protease
MIPLYDNMTCKSKPIVTIVLILLNILGFGYELSLSPQEQEDLFMTWGVVPLQFRDALQATGTYAILAVIPTLFSYMFLHGGIMHLVGNMVFLQAFGRGVEARLGHVKFIVFYLLGGIAAACLQMFSQSTSDVPMIGASGAIAAVLGAYFMFWPKAKFKTIILIVIFPIFINLSAYIFIGIWFLMQLTPGIEGLAGESADGVAYLAHIGGALAGVFFASIYHLIYPISNVCEVPVPTDCACPNTESDSESQSPEGK